MENIKELYSSISIPSTVHSYSVAIEYMKEWFLKKFNNNYFKTIHIDGKHVLDDFRRFDKTKSLKRLNPSVSIIPELEFDFNRDNLDLYQFGTNLYNRRSKKDTAFIRDIERNLHMNLSLDALKLNFTFRMRVGTKAKQIDLYRYLQMAFRIGSTQGEDVDIDYHIPYDLMIQLAKDSGFKVENNKVTNVLDFVSYLNSKSKIPILYKHRTINGKGEYFLRFTNVYFHIDSTNQLSVDDGEREGMLMSNFGIEMRVTLTMPTIKMLNYYSTQKHENINIDTDDGNIGLYSIKIPDIPEVNSKGWNDYLTTEYYEDERLKILCIKFKELIENSKLERVIEHTKSLKLSPSIFVDFKLFNDSSNIEYDIDWDSYTITTKDIVTDNVTNIIMYVDTDYFHMQLEVLDSLNKDRIRTKK